MVVLAEKKAWSPAKSVHTGSSKTGFVYVLGLKITPYNGSYNSSYTLYIYEKRVYFFRNSKN